MKSSSAERAVVVGLDAKGLAEARVEPGESLDELVALAQSAGAEVCARVLQKRPSPDAATLVGRGKAEEIAELAAAHDAGVVLFNHDLSPTQLRNLERLLDRKVLDRTQLILDIFARRARTREGQLQVELAQLNYLLPRLTGRGAAMSRLGGGIGTRGPGETRLETDRRRIYTRIQRIERQLESVRSSRSIQRRQRQAVPLATVALVGYTNAGKSTLFNRLTGAGVTADARLFATLDPTVRRIVLRSKRAALLSDTVGFIRNLPTTLVKAFRATLEEATEAQLLVHVMDASDPAAAEYARHVDSVLREIGAGETPRIVALNKQDLLPSDAPPAAIQAERLGVGVAAVAVSARDGTGVEELLRTIDERLELDRTVRAVFRFPAAEEGQVHWLHEHGRVLRAEYDEAGCEVEAEAPESICRRLRAFQSNGA